MNNRLAFRRLFEPINIGKMTLKNRFTMPAMGTGFYTKEGLATNQTKDYYEARARGGAGLVIVECACVDFPRGIHAEGRLVIDSDITIPGLTVVAKAIKKHGARAAIQLHHAGRVAKSRITGLQPVAPSPIPLPAGGSPEGETPRELTADEISEIVALYVRAAARARKAGFEGIEVHAAHGYLLAQFLSPFSNKRRDRYGGSVENRARILIEILGAIRKSVGDDYPLWCRINGQEFGIENGLTLEDTKTIARMINNLVDAIHVSAWGYGSSALISAPDIPGALLPLAAAIKKVVTVPVIAVGRLSPELGEQAIKDGKADIIALGKRSIADPEIPGKVLASRLDDITPCIACFHCQDAGVIANHAITCTVNASLGREGEYGIRPARKIKKIAIIGAGPAGMEAARVLALRGHKIVIYEKEARPGGQVNLAMALAHKRERLEPLITYFVAQLNKLNVEMRLNTEANPGLIESLEPAAVVLATGAMPLVPQLPGVTQGNAVTANEILAGRVETGRNVVIIGGGSVGCETGEFLCEKGKEVTVVEMLPKLATDMGFRDRTRLLLKISGLPITFLTNARCSGIRKDGVSIITGENKEQFIKADTVVLAVGARPNNSLFPLLRKKGIETHLIGDCWQIGKIVDAIDDGSSLGRRL